MPAPQPTAPYDALTAEARELLFRTASYLSPSEQAELEKAKIVLILLFSLCLRFK